MTTNAGMAQLVEHFTRNEGVVCSSHITSSRKPLLPLGRRGFRVVYKKFSHLS